MSHGPHGSVHRLPCSGGAGGHHPGRREPVNALDIFALQVCPILGQVFGPASGVNLDSWCQTRGFQVGILVRYGLGGLILVLVAFQRPVEPT